MNARLARTLLALVLIATSGGSGYAAGARSRVETVHIPAQIIRAPEPESVRLLYSLDKKQNDKEIIALIDNAEKYAYFAVYTFTHDDIADALIQAKKRGVEVRGIVDSEQSKSSYGVPIIEKLTRAGIPVFVEKHASGNGIMHLKVLVTDSAYATGSYNWTKSATTINDEVLEIGTDPELRQAYENILRTLLDAYKGNAATEGRVSVSIGTIEYTEASRHVGEYASVRGLLINAHTAKSGTVFLDFCKDYKTCPFTAVIFADDAKKFKDLSQYEGHTITVTGKISLYEGRAEIILEDPTQLAT
jgi:hypothetical protein